MNMTTILNMLEQHQTKNRQLEEVLNSLNEDLRYLLNATINMVYAPPEIMSKGKY